jgi:hypothetical protein
VSAFPEPTEVIRTIDPVRWARGGFVYRCTLRLDNGHVVSFWETDVADRVVVCESREAAFDLLCCASS